MIRIIKRTLIILFVFSAALFGYGYYKTQTLRDHDGPKIEMTEDSITISVRDSELLLLQGINAYDAKDGNVTDSLVVQGLSKFVEKGRREASIAAFDSDNNVVRATRDVWYSDYISPRFSLEKPLSFPVGTRDSVLEHAVKANDCLDGYLSNKITVEMESSDDWIDTSVEGSVRLVYSVINSAGDIAELPVTVTVYNTSSYSRIPKIRLKRYIVYLAAGDSFSPKEYVLGMEEDEETLPADWRRIRITDPVDPSVPGVYEVIYSVSDESGRQVSKVYLPVVVE